MNITPVRNIVIVGGGTELSSDAMPTQADFIQTHGAPAPVASHAA
jgi:hypothetical protein